MTDAKELEEAAAPFVAAYEPQECVVCTTPGHPGAQYCAACDGTNFTLEPKGRLFNSRDWRALADAAGGGT